jgi:hypothetical protein
MSWAVAPLLQRQILQQYFRYLNLDNNAAALAFLKKILGLNVGAKQNSLYVIEIILTILSLCLIDKYVTVRVGSSYKLEQRIILIKVTPESTL